MNKRSNNSILNLVIIMIFLMFGFGFIIGTGFMYSQYSNEISDLKDDINDLKLNDNISNITFYYNETSLSIIYDMVKDSIVEINGLVEYQSFFSVQYGKVQGSGF